MGLSVLDWSIIILFLAASLAISLKYQGVASKSLSDFFLGGRNLPWYIAGISMVATTFAADTPLWVTEKIAQHGISGNWMWWNMVIGGMLTTFFFARLWRRAEILTELEFIELRYNGRPAQFLRGLKSVYLGIFLNAVVIGWVNSALMKILQVFFDVSYLESLFLVGGAMLIVAIYSSLAGIIGVVITDALQFTIAMIGCIVLAVIVLNSEKIGGIDGLKQHLKGQEWRMDFFPAINSGTSVSEIASVFSLSIGAFLSYIGFQWWASWYPGAEPGGGGYISQRMMSTKNESHAVFATLFFQVAHYCLRPWPWIIVGLCALVLYPDLPIEESGKGFVYVMKDFLPSGLRGLLLVAFLGAYMSTISTQLNWGASYLTNDLYKRFIKTEKDFKPEEDPQKHYVLMGKLFTVAIMVVSFFATTQITSIDSAANFLISCGAGLGLVLILRWYWWRINVWSEISATLAPFIAYSVSIYILEPKFGQGFIHQNGTFFITVGFTSITWLIVTILTKPTDKEHLIRFYQKVRPDGLWNPIRRAGRITSPKSQLKDLVICWISSVFFVYGLLFFIGKIIFKEWDTAAICLTISVVSLVILKIYIKRTNII